MTIRRIKPEDNPIIGSIIRQVMTEFGASGEGYSIHDAEVGNMYESYDGPQATYYVVEEDGRVLGGAGIAPLAGGDDVTCELKKMYFLPEARGRGMGKMVMQKCLEAAKKIGYKRVYIETVARMTGANKLYASFGFKKINGPLGATGHHSCETFYIFELEES